ncbi:hypothetical protein [Rhizorhabdus wittichii]|uniref:hypothetical protein n=1 Tax=Rhizorhabdus wittichii TaxID=160791 RepID=UPI00036634EB|nr:hypothetical protein [Rhizorhabdus wittichii]
MNIAKLKWELLRDPLAKINRAKKHITDLNGQITEYLADNPFELRIRQRSEPADRLIYVKAKPAIPNDFALIIGDAVHNLRTALDFICYSIASPKAPNRSKIGFPFVGRAENLAGAINTRQMNVAPKHVIDEIHALQPYPDGNKYLHAVKSMDERDKHHFIILVGYGIELTLEQLRVLVGPEQAAGVPAGVGKVSTLGDFIVILRGHGPVESFDRKADFQPPFFIGFGPTEALIGQQVIPALKAMVDAAEDAVYRIARAYFQ